MEYNGDRLIKAKLEALRIKKLQKNQKEIETSFDDMFDDEGNMLPCYTNDFIEDDGDPGYVDEEYEDEVLLIGEGSF